jgi:hypothetical protein
MFTFLSAFTPARNIDLENPDSHITLIGDRVIAALQHLPESEQSPLMPRWELGLAKELVCIRLTFLHADSTK